MIPFVLADMPQQEVNIFDCISMQNDVVIPAKEIPLIDYLITVYPRNENANAFSFVYGLFDSKDLAFARNQDSILKIAKELFSDSMPLNKLEQQVLNSTYKKGIKQNSSLPGRK